MRIRTTALGLAGGAALLLGSLAAPAQAATSAPERRGWENTGQTFFWEASCDAAGKAGLGKGWSAYDCKGSTWRNYELWVYR
ncbi:hypothetical protein [Actinomadura hibisca]|uniref:hypothetical protein n=1 Tax=Actinomadura hibisca TaxID=68565 RepID=UPI0008340884|nr:hypothetical protein [Actinomadura hibisca]